MTGCHPGRQRRNCEAVHIDFASTLKFAYTFFMCTTDRKITVSAIRSLACNFGCDPVGDNIANTSDTMSFEISPSHTVIWQGT
ncbi:hypothetical protein B0G73_13653 [Paraburkholderia sp. BL25I1N1]|nr:hypothetical protein B0G73_13653 [Paraburkholderia sp. BL25I1N1]